MEIGFAVPLSGSWATTDNIATTAERAEAAGYHSLWTFQRLLSPVGDDGEQLLPAQYRSVQDPLAVLAYLAGRTTKPRLGVAIVNLPFYAPIVLAKALTTIDHLSNGRLDAGLGIGWMPQELEAVGMSSKERGRRAEDFLACLDTIWTDEVVEHHGPYYDVPPSKVEPKPIQAPRPPILLGGTAEAALQRAGRLADGWISSSQADLSKIDESIDVVKQAAIAAGRDPDALRFICRGVVKVRSGERGPLTGSFDDIRSDLADLATKGITETFIDLNFDNEVASPDLDPSESMEKAIEVLDALAPG
jgi:probable F420-dependent oxidoreductase